MNLSNSAYMFVLLTLLSCHSIKNNNSDNKTNIKQTQKMISNGFKKGVIIVSNTKTDCPYIIKAVVEEKVYFLDPIDLPDAFKNNEKKVWFKYTRSRRPKRCEKADPVILDNLIYTRN